MNDIAAIAEIRFPNTAEVYMGNEKLTRVVLPEKPEPRNTFLRARVIGGWIELIHRKKDGGEGQLLIPATKAGAIIPRMAASTEAAPAPKRGPGRPKVAKE